MTKEEIEKHFVQDANLEWEQLDDKVRRKIMAYEQSLMLVKVEFKAGGVGVVHQHPHVQITHVHSGVFEVEIEKEKTILKAGDVFHIPSNLWHGAVCIEDGVLIDVFSPVREDFIQNI